MAFDASVDAVQRMEVGVAADDPEKDPFPVDGDLEFVRILQSARRVRVRPEQFDLKHVLAVERKHVPHQRPADSAERLPLDMPILRKILPDTVGLTACAESRLADGQRADHAGRVQVALEQNRRHPEQVRDVVEAEC